jgi:sulfite reductase (NADPH) flavoprotein alpha-component
MTNKTDFKVTTFTNEFTKEDPCLVKIFRREKLNQGSSDKITYHIELDLSGTNFIYQVGDSIGIFATNDQAIVLATIEQLGRNRDEQIIDRKSGRSISLQQLLESERNIATIPTKIAQKIAETTPILRERLEQMDRKEIRSFLDQFELWDFIRDYGKGELTLQEIADQLSPLLPRFYSIASSQSLVRDKIELTVALTKYVTNGIERTGVCSGFLCERAKIESDAIAIYLQPTADFRPPLEKRVAMIMVGPGTGVAPFRAFLQERILVEESGDHWLFFGGRSERSDYYYRDYFESLQTTGKLRLDTAFSRDQAEKIYVQHKMWNARGELWNWLETGAHFYVCGDAKNMAKDVESTLVEIAKDQGKLSETEAKEYLKELRKQKRYLRDVY